VFRPDLYIDDYTRDVPGKCSGTRGISWVVYEALTFLDDQIYFGNYDENNDGFVDFIIVWFRNGCFNVTDCSPYDGYANLAGLTGTFMGSFTEFETQDYKNGQRIKIKSENGLIANGYSPMKTDIMVHEISHLMGQNWHANFGWHLGKWCMSEARTGVGIPTTFERGGLGWLLENTTTVIDVPGTYFFTLGNDNPLSDYESTGKNIQLSTQYTGAKYHIENRVRFKILFKIRELDNAGKRIINI
jgi:hypothetical protein